ncbi:MAG: hypothetical protein IJB09_06610 [Oscillospiraceae bacterium]|nr:hypothetical protein [Oscillospiraceae bacterium]
MTDINRHNFLAELSKLLTFMYEEDRLTALNMYEDIFQSCQDEQQLVHHLVSPTRQAVILARAYDSKERMLHVDTRSKKSDLYEDEEDMVPGFVLAIEKIRSEVQQLLGETPALPVPDEQMSLFTAEAEQQSLIPTVEEIIVDSAQAEEKTASEEIAEVTVEEAVSDVAAEEEAGDDPVDAFLAEYENEVPVIYREENVQEQMSRHESARVRNIRRERSVPLLILYYLAAIPLCLVATLVLLIPTLISLALAFVFAVAGIAAVSCAFGSFVIFADILVVLGAGLVLLALGLLFLWLFVWFIGGAIAGMINGAIKLGNRLCTKEVAA